MRWFNRVARTLLGLDAGAYIGIHAVARAHPAPGWNVGLLVVGGALIVCLLVTEPALRARRPTLHLGRLPDARGISIWPEPPAISAFAKRRERAERKAITERLEAIASEYLLIKREIPPDGPVITPDQQAANASVKHLAERVRSELRVNARGFMEYWMENPDTIPAPPPWSAYLEAFIDATVEQLRHIADRIRQGHDSP